MKEKLKIKTFWAVERAQESRFVNSAPFAEEEEGECRRAEEPAEVAIPSPARPQAPRRPHQTRDQKEKVHHGKVPQENRRGKLVISFMHGVRSFCKMFFFLFSWKSSGRCSQFLLDGPNFGFLQWPLRNSYRGENLLPILSAKNG